jgi:hypothetical protein
MAFRPSAEDLDLMIQGEDIYIGLLVGDHPQTPINVIVGKEAAARLYNEEVDLTKPEKT